MRDRRAVASDAGLTGAPDESGARRREQGLARAGNARVRRGMIQLAWRFLMFQRESTDGPTAADARNVMVEGASGILAISPDPERPLYEPSKRRLTWPNGAVATTYSADEPERLRRGMASSSNIVWGALDLGLRCSAVAVASIRRAARSRQLLCADDAQALLRKGANEGSGRVAGHFSGPAGTPASLRR